MNPQSGGRAKAFVPELFPRFEIVLRLHENFNFLLSIATHKRVGPFAARGTAVAASGVPSRAASFFHRTYFQSRTLRRIR
jgi:hypothetical protein